MRKFTKVILIVFAITSLATILINILEYKNSNNLMFMLIALIFNFSFLMLISTIVEWFIENYKKKWLYLVAGFLVSFLLCWYLISSFLYIYYGTFLSLTGVIYIISTRTIGEKIILFLIFFSACAIPGFFIYLYSKNNQDKNKINGVLITIFIIILILTTISLPKTYSHEISPFVDFAKSIKSRLESIKPAEIKEGTAIFNLSINLQKPNIIFITLESISAKHLHYWGYEKNITPNIDKLAEKGIVFKNAYTTATHTDYAVPSYLSSRYTFTNEYRTSFNEDYPKEFIWDVLKENGYKTAFISAQDEEWANMISYYNKTNLDLFWHSLSDERWDYGYGLDKKDFDENTAKIALSWMNITIEPFFLYLNLQATHYPYEYPENNSLFLPDEPSTFTNYLNILEEDYNASLNRYDNALYYVDKQIGKILNYLEKRNLTNTIIVLTADHGETLNKTHEFFRHGYGVYEENIHIPLIFYIPGQKPFEINERVRHLDVIPTILDILKFPQSENFQGTPMKTNQKIFLVTQNQNYKLGLIKDNIKFILDAHTYLFEAYNLTKDPLEKDNLIKNEKDEIYYVKKYGNILINWYNCQMNYYQEKKYEQGEKITCP